MKKIFLPLLFLSCSYIYSDELKSDCAQASEYVMQYLKISTFQDGTDWLNGIENNGAKIKTVFARTRNDSEGVTVLKGTDASTYDVAHQNKELNLTVDGDYASGSFTIYNNDGVLEITSSMIDTAAINVADIQVEDLHGKIAEYNGKKAEQSDEYSSCSLVLELYLNEDSNKLEQRITSNCTTKIALAEFLKAVEAAR